VSESQNWTATNATIYTADYVEPGGTERPFWRLTYSYRVGDEYYSGECTDFATDSEMEYHKNDNLAIEYSNHNPRKSRVPSETTWWSKARTPYAIGGALALAVYIIYLITHR
jgi:chitodextrinase